MDEVFDLKESKRFTGLSVERLRLMILAGKIAGIQPNGPHGKLFIPKAELERLRQPVTPRGQ